MTPLAREAGDPLAPAAPAKVDAAGPPGPSGPSGPFIDLGPTAAPTLSPSPLLQAVAPAATKWLPTGKGRWIYLPQATEGGNVAGIVAKAKATGLTYLWVRMGSAWDGFNVVPFLNNLLPAAHAAGVKVVGWDFPKLEPIEADVARALAMIGHTTPSGDRIDAFSADIETRAEGTRLTADAARAYGAALRAGVGDGYPLIATVPRPSKQRSFFPYGDVTASYDAIAPMVYWLNRQPDTDVAGAIRDLAQFGKPIFPIGQAYDGSPEGGGKGVPPPDELRRFMAAAKSAGATSLSFWSWQHANEPAWAAIGAYAELAAAEVLGTVVIAPDRPGA